MSAQDHPTITNRAADIADTIDRIQLGRWAEGKAALTAAIVALVEEATAGAPRPVLPRGAGDNEELHEERGYGVFCVESDEGPLFVMFGPTGEDDARRELTRRQKLDPEVDDDWLSEDHTVARCETAMLVWNSVDPDPRVALEGEG